jgi:hypothetical protein
MGFKTSARRWYALSQLAVIFSAGLPADSHTFLPKLHVLQGGISAIPMRLHSIEGVMKWLK